VAGSLTGKPVFPEVFLLRHVQIAAPGTDHVPATLTGNCGAQPGLACRLVWNVSHNAQAAALTKSFLAGPVHMLLRVVFVLVIALVVRYVLHRLINRFTERATQAIFPPLRTAVPARRPGRPRVPRARVPRGRVPRGSSGGEPVSGPSQAGAAQGAAGAPQPGQAPGAGAGDGGPPATAEAAAVMERAMIGERRKQRVRALGALLRSAASITIFAVAGLDILSDLGINLAPLMASAGVVGIAIGFGAQSLVRDYLSGIFMLVEDQYGVGDVVNLGTATGTVENVTLRITRLRDTNGVLWHIRNGSVQQVANESQGWARAVIDYPVPYQNDLAAITGILSDVAEAMWNEPEWRAVMVEAPEIWGAQTVTSSEVTIRIVVKTAPLRQWSVEREMRARIHAALDAAGIQFS
jgi:small-conductance mechanosensitive channel